MTLIDPPSTLLKIVDYGCAKCLPVGISPQTPKGPWSKSAAGTTYCLSMAPAQGDPRWRPTTYGSSNIFSVDSPFLVDKPMGKTDGRNGSRRVWRSTRNPSSERVLTWGTPQLIHFNRIFYYKPSSYCGNPHGLRKPPSWRSATSHLPGKPPACPWIPFAWSSCDWRRSLQGDLTAMDDYHVL